MSSTLFGRDVLSLADLTPQEVQEILDVAADFKAHPEKCINEAPLKGKALAIIMQKPSLRTRVSFEVACSRLGAHPVVMTGSDGAFSRGEPVNDTAHVLERFCDAIILRTFDDALIKELAEHAQVPVVNALTDGHHPCQGLADLLTIKEKFGSFEGLKFVYTGDGANNMAHTYLLAGALVGTLSDFLGTLLFPTAGAYFPPLTVAFLLIGLTAGILSRVVKVKQPLLRVAMIVIPSEIIGSYLFKSFALNR